jgi:queuine tRNA-ribosyltransferase
MLMTEHNIGFYQQLMAGLRAAIAEGRLKAFAATFRANYGKSAGTAAEPSV